MESRDTSFKKMHDQFTTLLFKPVLINNVEDIVACIDQKVINSDHFLHCLKYINSANHFTKKPQL